nr:BMC domain-containing protein [Desulfoluna sp.]
MNDKVNGKALGLIETMGLVPAVEAGDVAVKTADVTILGLQAVGGGLVSILFTGDVSAVKASVDAASAAATRLGEVCSITVIARTAEGLEGILIEEGKCPRCFPHRSGSANKPAGQMLEPVMASAPLPVCEEAPCSEASVKTSEASFTSDSGSEPLSFDLADLKKLKVTKLRRLARQLPTFSIARGEIKYAKKKDLLEAFAQYMKTLEK